MASAEQKLTVIDTNGFRGLVNNDYKNGIAEFKRENSGFVTALVLPTGAVVPRFDWARCLDAHNFLPDLSQVNASGVEIPNSNFTGILLVNKKTGRAFKIGNANYSSFGSNRSLRDIEGADLGSTDLKKVYGLAMASEKKLEKKQIIRTTYGDIGRFFVGQLAQQRQAIVRVNVPSVAAKKEEKKDSNEDVMPRQPLPLLSSLSPHRIHTHTPKRSKRKAGGAGDQNVDSQVEVKADKSPTGSSPSRVMSPEPEQEEQIRIKRSKQPEINNKTVVDDNVFGFGTATESKYDGELTLFRRPRTPDGRMRQLHDGLKQMRQAAPGMYDIGLFGCRPSSAMGSSASSEPASLESALAPLPLSS